MPTSNNYFNHDADTGIIGRGSTIELAFIDAAKAMFALMADISSIKPTTSLTIEFDEDDNEFALVAWLNLLLAEASSRGLLLAQFELHHDNGHWYGKAIGEPWREALAEGTEVKGATLTMLSVKKLEDGQWEARCVVDL